MQGKRLFLSKISVGVGKWGELFVHVLRVAGIMDDDIA